MMRVITTGPEQNKKRRARKRTKGEPKNRLNDLPCNDAFLKNAFQTESFKDLVINSRKFIPPLDFRTWNGHL